MTRAARTPLMMMAAFSQAAMVQWLFDHGASPDARDASGLRAIDAARGMGAAEAIAVLEGQSGQRAPTS